MVDVRAKVIGRKDGYTPARAQNLVNFVFKDNVYKLTDEEVEWLRARKELKENKQPIFSMETMETDLNLLKNQKSVLDILKDCLDQYKDQPSFQPKDISEIISITDRIIEIYKLAQNKE
jgi:hypothetical protein